ncbi:putative Heterokaryon incompatibility protein-domain-containing protein [Seiridium unicorne]|uniref:Heterokaryon incompatibility protein-domain-containing protein n=1 Tax=Seiridium unicorne TaxID=138068 RepID=A0ABR2V3F6_9PEZI
MLSGSEGEAQDSEEEDDTDGGDEDEDDEDYDDEEMGEDDEMGELMEEYGEDVYDDDYLNSYEALSDSLENLRSKLERRVLWVDAVCINPDGVSEKGRQVSLMGMIYGLAKTVTVWLGPGEMTVMPPLHYLKI